MSEYRILLIDDLGFSQSEGFAKLDPPTFGNEFSALGGGQIVDLQVHRRHTHIFLQLAIDCPKGRGVDYRREDPSMNGPEELDVFVLYINIKKGISHAYIAK